MRGLVVGLILMLLLVGCGGGITQITPMPNEKDSQDTNDSQQLIELQTQQDCERIHRSGVATMAKASALNDIAPRFYCGDFKFGDFAFSSDSQNAEFDGQVFLTIDKDRKIVGTAIPKTSTNTGVIWEQATITGEFNKSNSGDVFLALTATFPTAGSYQFFGNVKITKFSDNGLSATVIGSPMVVEYMSDDVDGVEVAAILSVVNKE